MMGQLFVEVIQVLDGQLAQLGDREVARPLRPGNGREQSGQVAFDSAQLAQPTAPESASGKTINLSSAGRLMGL